MMNNISGFVALIKKSFQIFFKKENFIYFLKIQAPLFPIVFISFIWSMILTFAAAKLPENLSTNPYVVFSVSILSFINSIIYLFVIVASFDAIKRVLAGSQMSVREAFLVAKQRVWKYFLMNFLKGIILFFGFLLLIIPGVIFSIWFAFSGIEIVVNGAGVKESLSKSKALVKGRFWVVFGRLFGIGAFTAITHLVLISFPLGIGSLVSPLLGILFILPTYLLYQELAVRGQSPAVE